MTSQLSIIFLFSFFAFPAAGQPLKSENPFNPTGSYELVSNAKIKNGDVYGYAGEIEVKLLDSARIAMSFYVTKGMPSYNSGDFVDTLFYKSNFAIYKTGDDTTCTITFKFSPKGVTVEEKTANYNFGCGFGHAVVASGFYKKKSSKIPDIKDPLMD